MSSLTFFGVPVYLSSISFLISNEGPYISTHGQKIGFLTDFELLKLCADTILELD